MIFKDVTNQNNWKNTYYGKHKKEMLIKLNNALLKKNENTNVCTL